MGFWVYNEKYPILIKWTLFEASEWDSGSIFWEEDFDERSGNGHHGSDYVYFFESSILKSSWKLSSDKRNVHHHAEN